MIALLFVLLVSVSCDAGVINVKSHGAVGDGHHDDTKSIAAALTLVRMCKICWVAAVGSWLKDTALTQFRRSA